MPHRLAQQRMTVSDFEWYHPHRMLSLRQLSFLSQFYLEERWGMDVKPRRGISRTVEDGG